MNTKKVFIKTSALALLTTGLIAGPVSATDTNQVKDGQYKDASPHPSNKREAKQYWSEFKQDTNQSWKDSKSAFRDGWVEGKLETAIIANESLSLFDIDVEVDNNTAVLTGTVSTPIEKELAENIALGVEGVDDVDNKITVDEKYSVSEEKQKERTFSTYLSDVSTTAAIKTELLSSDNVSGLDINVDTYRSSVTLKGKVDSVAQKELAEKIAEKRDDVISVNNQLVVGS